MNNIKITQKQMKAIAGRISEVYYTLYSANDLPQPHYEHITIDNKMFKIGFVPDESNSRTIMNIRIVYKGNIDGK